MATVDVADAERTETGDDLTIIEKFVGSVAARLRLARIIRSVSWGVILSCTLLVGGRATYILLPSPLFFWSFSPLGALALFVVLIVAFAVVGLIRRYDRMMIARYADEKLNLKDRLATALSLGLLDLPQELAQSVLRDAAKAISQGSASRAVSLKWGRLQSAALVSMIVALLLTTLPYSPISTSSNQFKSAVTVQKQNTGGLQLRYLSLMGRLFSQKPVPLPKTAKVGASHFIPPNKTAVSAHSPSSQAGKTGSQSGKQEANTNELQTQKAGALAQATAAVDKLNQKMGAPSYAGRNSGLAKPGSGAQTGPPGNKVNPENIPTLGQKLREFADRLEARRLTTGEEQQASESLDKVNHKLDGLQMPLTQGKLSSSEQDLNDDQQQQAIKDIRSAAYYADHEGATVPPGQSDESGSPSKDDVAIPTKNGAAGSSSGNSHAASSGSSASGQKSSSAGSSSGAGQPGAGGGGSGSSTNTAGGLLPKGQSDAGYGGGTQKPNFAAHPWFKPVPVGQISPLPPVSLPVSNALGRSYDTQGKPGSITPSGPSTVPYVHQVYQYRTDAEKTMSTDKIPPAYKDIVRKYFSSSSPNP